MDISKEDLLKLTPAQWEARFAKQRREHIEKNGPSASPVLDQLAIHGRKSPHESLTKTTKKLHPLAWAGIGFGSLLFLLGGISIVSVLSDPEYAAKVAAEETKSAEVAKTQAAQQAQQAAAQQAASEALQRETNMFNSVRSECWQFARRSVKNPSSLQMAQESWVNGDVTSDFVVIQPVTAENSFGARVSATAVCSGNNGVITSYEMDDR